MMSFNELDALLDCRQTAFRFVNCVLSCSLPHDQLRRDPTVRTLRPLLSASAFRLVEHSLDEKAGQRVTRGPLMLYQCLYFVRCVTGGNMLYLTICQNAATPSFHPIFFPSAYVRPEYEIGTS